MNTFLLAKNIFNKKEIEDFFDFIEKRISKNDMKMLNRGLVYPALFRRNDEIYKHDFVGKLQNLINEKFNFKKLKISLHSDYHIETLGGWHTDEGKDFGGYLPEDLDGKSKIYKCGVYLCSDQSKLKKTMISFKEEEETIKPDTEIGDVIFFPIEVTHRGYQGNMFVRMAYSFLIRFDKFFNTKITNNFTNLRLNNTKNFRKAFFFTFGEDSEILAYFENKNFKREADQINS